jgi:diguanylate cyclase (GGDEF)-like protein
MIRLSKYLKLCLQVCMTIFYISFLVIKPAQAAESILDVDSKTKIYDLEKFRTPIAAERNKIAVQGPGDEQPLDLVAKGPGPTFFWSLFSFNNVEKTNLDFVLGIPRQRFAGSGLLNVKEMGESAISITTTTGTPLEPLSLGDMQAFDVRLEQAKTLNVAVESRSPDITASLYQRTSLEQQTANFSFFKGLVLGVALLVVLSIVASLAFRPHANLRVGVLFALSCLLFIVLECDGLAVVNQRFGLSYNLLYAITESLMGITLALCVINFTQIKATSPILNIMFLVLLALLSMNIIYAFVEANYASTIARLFFGFIAFAGFAITTKYRNTVKGIVDPGLLFWVSIFAWAIFAGIVSQTESRGHVMGPILIASLAACLVALLGILLKFMFSQGLAAKPFIHDSSRRSLALSSAFHYLWEWLPYEKTLDIGEELPKALGYDSKSWRNDPRSFFFNLIHPLDAPLYQNEIGDPKLEIGHVFDLELRLRNSKGNYQWFALRARAVPGQSSRLDRCIGTLTDISRAKETEEKLFLDAVHDPVTHLPSRALFMDRLERELAKPTGLPVRYLLIDLDRFKNLNETLGHDLGDRILLLVGGRILECLAPDETVARISGSQFAVLIIEAMARRSVESLSDEIAKALSTPIELPGQDVFLTASIGASAASSRGTSAIVLQQQAASALLEARKLGGAQMIEFDSSMKDERAAMLAMETDLRNAMRSDEIEVQYQPIMHLNSMEIAGFEALARWRHPTLGLLPPIQFIELAEQVGMINEIGQTVLAQAARQLGIWQRVLRHERPFFVSVNISPTHLMEANFLEQLQIIINRESLSTDSLKIEVTESVIMRHPERAAKLFERLRSLGVGLACDDFGTGFSNFSSLRNLPFDTLKLDRSFIAPESFDQRSGKIITTITELAHSLGMLVVAEGIEDQDQVDRLALLGCDLGQGYLIGQPMPSTQVTDMLAVLPRIIAQNTPPVPEEAPVRKIVTSVAPMALRKPVEIEEEPEELPSIFAMPQQVETKAKPTIKRAKPKATVKKAKKR